MKLKINVVKFQTHSFLLIHHFHYCYENSLLLRQIIIFFSLRDKFLMYVNGFLQSAEKAPGLIFYT